MATAARDPSDTRKALIVAAVNEFAEKGYKAASVNAICANAKFSRGAYYFHFSSKEDLLLEAMKFVLEEFYEKLSARSGLDLWFEKLSALVMPRIEAGSIDDPPTFVRTFTGMPFHRMIAACDELGSVRRLFAELEGGAHVALGRNVRRQQEIGAVRKDVDHVHLAELLVVLGIGMVAAAELGFEYDPAAVSRTALEILAPYRDEPPAAD